MLLYLTLPTLSAIFMGKVKHKTALLYEVLGNVEQGILKEKSENSKGIRKAYLNS